MITFLDIDNPLLVLDHWHFFLEGLRSVSKKTKEPLDEAAMLKTFCWLATIPEFAFMSIVRSEDQMVGYCVFQDATPRYISERTFVNRIFYHKGPTSAPSIALLQHFEAWARRQGVKRYVVSTRRPSGSRIHLFENKYGLTKTGIIFEKEL